MAQFLVNVVNGGNSQVYQNSGATKVNVRSQITQINDGNDSDDKLVVGENVKVTFYTLNLPASYVDRFDMVYKGTVEWPTGSGEKYLVVADGNDWYMVGHVGSQSAEPPNLSTLLVAETFTVCFFPGTLIATPSGERKVEELVSGDLVLIGDSGAIPATWFGRKFARAVSVKWIGRQTVSTLFGPAERLMPVRFAAGSLGGGGGATPFAA